jgi:hypothetical protein
MICVLLLTLNVLIRSEEECGFSPYSNIGNRIVGGREAIEL